MAFYIKQDANIQGLQLPMRKAIIYVESLLKKLGVDTVITSGMDGTHSAGSFHYYGLALDFRTRDIPSGKIPALVEDLKTALGPDYFVLYEGDHLHVDYRRM